MTERPNPDPEVAAHMERDYLRQVDRFTQKLRDTADQIERRKKIRANDQDGFPDYSESLQTVMHDLQTMLGNLPIDRLISTANDVHVYVRVGTLDPA